MILASCGGGSAGSSSSGGTSGTFIDAAQFDYPPTIAGSPAGFFVEQNSGGGSNTFALAEMTYGRLVDVYDRDPNTGDEVLRFRDFVIGEEIGGIDNDPTYEIKVSPVTQKESLVIKLPYGPGAAEQAAFRTALLEAGTAQGPIVPKPDVGGTPPFSFVPRNGAIVLRFNDLIDMGTVSAATLKLLIGNAPTLPFDCRILPDPNYGGVTSSGGSSLFRPTRVILDTTVSESEAQSSTPTLAVNVAGLPAALTTGLPNVAVRIPTQIDFGSAQFTVLKNLSGHSLAAQSNHPIDLGSPTIDVVRAMRSGGQTAVTGDSNNGFLFDATPPRVLGTMAVTVSGVIADVGAGEGHFLANLTFAASSCAQRPVVGDIVELSSVLAEVTTIGQPPSAGVVIGAKLHLLSGNATALVVGGQGTYKTPFDPVEDAATAGCFVNFFPAPAQPPVTRVAPNAALVVRFTEPMDPGSVQPFDSLMISRNALTTKPDEIIVGSITSATDQTEFSLLPTLPLSHTQGTAEQYTVIVANGSKGVTDLSGNALKDALPKINFKLESTAATAKSGGLVLRFNSYSEIEESAGVSAQPELRDGSVVRDIANGLIRPRSVKRFSGIVDRTPGFVPSIAIPLPFDGQIQPGLIPVPFKGGVQEPLVKYGSRMMTMWRYCDMPATFPAVMTPDVLASPANETIPDESTYNIDVEHLNWTPFNTSVQADYFPGFQIELAHSKRFPDEFVDGTCIPPTLVSPESGFLPSGFEDNVLKDPADPSVGKKVVHAKGLGYLIDPNTKFLSGPSQSAMVPYPLNSGNDPSKYSYYTWRDTAVMALDGPQNMGVEPGQIVYQLANAPSHTGPNNTPPCGPNTNNLTSKIAPTAFIPSAFLPLLMDFKCYPTDQAIGLNKLDASLAVDPNVIGLQSAAGRKPFFTLWSSGGQDVSGTQIDKNPDLQPIPTGGFNPNELYAFPLGTPTYNADNKIMMGQVDFVVRVTRVPTLWFNTKNSNPTFAAPIVLPTDAEQPSGTSIVLAYRGATAITGAVNPILTSANCVNVYGDQPGNGTILVCGEAATFQASRNASINFNVSGDQSWQSSVSTLNGKQFYQVRVSFIGNTSTSLTPTLSALAFAFTTP